MSDGTVLNRYLDYNRSVLFAKLDEISKQEVYLLPLECSFGINESNLLQTVYKCNDIVDIMKPNHKSGQSSLRYINSFSGIVRVQQVLETTTNHARFFTLGGIQEYIAECPTTNGELLAEYFRVPYQSFLVTKNKRRLQQIASCEKHRGNLFVKWAFGRNIKHELPKDTTLDQFVIWLSDNGLSLVEEVKRTALELICELYCQFEISFINRFN